METNQVVLEKKLSMSEVVHRYDLMYDMASVCRIKHKLSHESAKIPSVVEDLGKLMGDIQLRIDDLNK